MILQNIWWRVVGYVLINISPLNIFLFILKLQSFHQTVLTPMSDNGLK